ncbi:MAG: tetratricopeptide repeat protein [Planctomycetes bacterium]|nr:tetratricopeptide repeat protein [Planctomycetota bacterium]
MRVRSAVAALVVATAAWAAPPWTTGGAAARAAEAPAAKSVKDLLDEASRARGRAEGYAEALRLCEEVLASPKAEVKDKTAAFEIMADVRRRQKKVDEAVAVMARMAKDLAGDSAAVRQAWFAQDDFLREADKKDQALATLRRFLDAHAADKPGVALAQVRIADLLRIMGKPDEAYDEAAKAIDTDPAADATVSRALWQMAETMWAKPDNEKALAALKRLIEERYLSKLEGWLQRAVRQRYGECLARLKRYDEARAWYAAQEKADREAQPEDYRLAQSWCSLIADLFLVEQRYEDARRAYERVLVDNPNVPDAWYDAQRRLADVLVKLNRPDDALRAARLCLDAAPDEGRVTDAVRLVAETFKAIDKDHVGRANAFINYQRFGPDGEDGKPGTADDLKDPLEGIPRASYPDRERAFEAARARAGDDDEGMRLRAMTYTFTGKPREALRCFIDAFARCRDNRVSDRGAEMIMVGARAVRGHSVGLGPFFAFVNYGPAGPDGKTGTGDDLPDPFAPLVK